MTLIISKSSLLARRTTGKINLYLAKEGRDSQIPLSTVEQAEAVSKSRSLNQGQTTALKQMVTSRDSVILIQGNAGVGKTYTMKAFAETVNDNQSIRGLAPSAGAPFKLLQEAGLPTATIDQNLRQRDPNLKQVVNSLATHDKNPDSFNGAYQKLHESGKIKQMLSLIKRM